MFGLLVIRYLQNIDIECFLILFGSYGLVLDEKAARKALKIHREFFNQFSPAWIRLLHKTMRNLLVLPDLTLFIQILD